MQTIYHQTTSGSRIEYIEIQLNELVTNKKLSNEKARHIINQFKNSAPGTPKREIAEFNFSNAIRYS